MQQQPVQIQEENMGGHSGLEGRGSGLQQNQVDTPTTGDCACDWTQLQTGNMSHLHVVGRWVESLGLVCASTHSAGQVFYSLCLYLCADTNFRDEQRLDGKRSLEPIEAGFKLTKT